MNRVELVGRVARAIELKKTNSGKTTTTFTLAVNRRGKVEADFIQCVAWEAIADLLGRYVHKGNRIGICGRIQTRSYESNGRTVYVTEVVVEELEFLESKPQGAQEARKEPQREPEPQGGDSINWEEELPF